MKNPAEVGPGAFGGDMTFYVGDVAVNIGLNGQGKLVGPVRAANPDQAGTIEVQTAQALFETPAGDSGVDATFKELS